MAYRVVKWVKGKPYAYLQRSFREGGTVRTVSEYLGPIDPADAPQKGAKPEKPRGDPSAVSSAKAARPADRAEVSAEPSGASKKIVRAVAEERIRIDPRIAKKGLSERVARRQHANMIASLAELGIPSDRVPPVIVRYGSKLAVKPRWWRGGFVVTVPRFERVKQRDVRAAFGVALGRATLEAFRTEKPELFARLSIAMDKGFHRTNAALSDYVRAGGHPDAWSWWIASRFLGYANPLPGRKAEEVGLTGYGARKNWSDDAAGIIGKLATSGWGTTHHQAERELARAKSDEARAMAALRNSRGIMGRIRRPELRRRLRAAAARKQATYEALYNIRTVHYFMNPPD